MWKVGSQVLSESASSATLTAALAAPETRGGWMLPASEFHLAFDKLFVESYRGSKKRNSLTIRFALVPASLPPRVDIWTLQSITLGGEPAGDVRVSPFDLHSVRQKSAVDGREDLAVEGMIIERLKERARARGHISPAILPTLGMPHWSRMEIEGDLLYELRRASV